MIALPEHLEQPFLHIAEIEHKPVMSIIEQALMQFLADYQEHLEDVQDAALADAAMDRLMSGESSTISLEEWSKQLNEMDN